MLQGFHRHIVRISSLGKSTWPHLSSIPFGNEVISMYTCEVDETCALVQTLRRHVIQLVQRFTRPREILIRTTGHSVKILTRKCLTLKSLIIQVNRFSVENQTPCTFLNKHARRFRRSLRLDFISQNDIYVTRNINYGVSTLTGTGIWKGTRMNGLWFCVKPFTLHVNRYKDKWVAYPVFKSWSCFRWCVLVLSDLSSMFTLNIPIYFQYQYQRNLAYIVICRSVHIDQCLCQIKFQIQFWYWHGHWGM